MDFFCFNVRFRIAARIIGEVSENIDLFIVRLISSGLELKGHLFAAKIDVCANHRLGKGQQDSVDQNGYRFIHPDRKAVAISYRLRISQICRLESSTLTGVVHLLLVGRCFDLVRYRASIWFGFGEALRARPPCGSLRSVPAGPGLWPASSPPLARPAHQGAALLPLGRMANPP